MRDTMAELSAFLEGYELDILTLSDCRVQFLDLCKRFETRMLNAGIIEPVQWKGKSGKAFEIGADYWIVREYRKDDQYTAAKKHEHTVYYWQAKYVYDLLAKMTMEKIDADDVNKAGVPVIAAREVWKRIITERNLGISSSAFFGERSAAYFSMYYYPIKVLEFLGIIKYSGGRITFLKNMAFFDNRGQHNESQ